VDRQFAFGHEETERFIEFMRLKERFLGMRVVTCCATSNHCRVLVEVPQRPADLPSAWGLSGVSFKRGGALCPG
jgi:REP element-mobilizing transposase RayT